jgi:hypothetical protein
MRTTITLDPDVEALVKKRVELALETYVAS